MAGAALMGVEHGLERFNASFPDPFYSPDIGTYLLPVFILGAAASFLPTAIAMSRDVVTVRKIFWRNAAAPAAIFLLMILPFDAPVARQLIRLLMSLAVCGGIIVWISTLLESLTGETRAPIAARSRHPHE